MRYARVVNLEYKSAEDVDVFYRKWVNWAPDNMPKAASRTNIRTSETSTLLMAIYKSEKLAENAREMANKFFKLQTEHLHEVIEFHGAVMD